MITYETWVWSLFWKSVWSEIARDQGCAGAQALSVQCSGQALGCVRRHTEHFTSPLVPSMHLTHDTGSTKQDAGHAKVQQMQN